MICLYACLLVNLENILTSMDGSLNEAKSIFPQKKTVGRIIRRSAVWTVFNGFDIPMGVRKNHAANNL